MIGKTDKNPQLNVFRTPLVSVINMKHELVELAQRIDWKSIEKDFAPYYADMGRPAVPVRKMVGCMLLKLHTPDNLTTLRRSKLTTSELVF